MYFFFISLILDKMSIILGLSFNFSTSQAIIDENIGEYFNLSIVKIGNNEPNVTVEIAIMELQRDVKGKYCM